MRSKQGFTLIELMIVVAIVAILAAIAYPSYRNQILRSHRAEAKAALLQVQVAQEKYFLQNNTYATNALLAVATNASTPGLGIPTTTPNGYYAISLPAATPTTYTARAAALGNQTADNSCVTFTIDNTGLRTPTTGCW